jgi:thymidylate synthase ThyX
VRYPVEEFTEEERRLLSPHFTNLDRPVFVLVNLPETIKGALFARYSRYAGTLRRLYLDEFAADVPEGGRPFEGEEGERAAGLYERVFSGFGDDSIAQLGGAHVACEWVSNVLTKALQRGRLAAYLEQSTRYIPYDQPLPDSAGGGHRFYRDDELGPEYAETMEELFAIYSRALAQVRKWAAERWPRGDQPEKAWERSIKAKALDLLRGLLPASTLSHVGIYASGQAYEQLLLRMLASPLPEARQFGSMILEELKKVMPSFVARVERPDRGGEWISYLERRREAAERWVSRLGLDRVTDDDMAPSVELIDVEGSEEELIAASLFESARGSERAIRDRVRALPPDEQAENIADLSGERANRRHRPGRGWEAVRYRFEIVSDYGGFRDLQRHRMLTVEWQPLSPRHGYTRPTAVDDAGIGETFDETMARSADLHDALAARFPAQAPYSVALAYRVRFVLQMNAREAMHLLELRSAPQGHPAYRLVAQEMHRLIAEQAGHRAVAEAMRFVDHRPEPQLERLAAERRAEVRRLSR